MGEAIISFLRGFRGLDRAYTAGSVFFVPLNPRVKNPKRPNRSVASYLVRLSGKRKQDLNELLEARAVTG